MSDVRLIDANALMKNIGKIPQLRGITYGRMKKAVEETPTIDALPVVHARWVQEYEDGWRCTRCGALWIFIDGGPEENGARFCPVCGAKMDAKE